MGSDKVQFLPVTQAPGYLDSVVLGSSGSEQQNVLGAAKQLIIIIVVVVIIVFVSSGVRGICFDYGLICKDFGIANDLRKNVMPDDQPPEGHAVYYILPFFFFLPGIILL